MVKKGKPRAGAADGGAKVADHAPKRVRDWVDLCKLAVFLLLSILIVLSSVWLKNTTSSIENDVRRASNPFSWLVLLPLSFLLNILLSLVVVGVFIQLLVKKLWVPSLTAALALITGFCASIFLSRLFIFLHIAGLFGQEASFGAGSFEVCTTTMSFLTASNGKSVRNKLGWAWKAYYAAVAVAVVGSLSTLYAGLMSLFAGAWIGLGFRLIFGTPGAGAWGTQLVSALKGCGIEAEKLERVNPSESQMIGCDNGSRSRYYSLSSSGRKFVMAVNDEQQHSLRYMKQVWNAIKMEGLSIRQDRSVRSMAEHHYAMLLSLNGLGARTPKPVAIGKSAESAFMVFPEPEGAGVCRKAASLEPEKVKGLISFLRFLHQKGVTHGNISPSALAQDGEGNLFLSGWSTGDMISSRAHKQIDMIQLLALVATFLGVEKTMEIAKEVMEKAELYSLSPYAQKVAIPKGTRKNKGWGKKVLKPLKAALEGMADEEEGAAQAVRLSRFNVRRFVTVFLVTVALVIVFTQLNFKQVIKAIEGANPWWCLAACAIGLVSWSGSGIAFGVFIDKAKRKGHYLGILGTQAVASFAAVSMPAAAGPIAVNITFLRKIGYKNTQATAIASADTVTEFSTTLLMFVALGFFTGQNVFRNLIPNKMIIIVTVAILVAALTCAMVVRPIRAWMSKRLLPLLKSYGSMLRKLFSHPGSLAVSMCGSILQNTTLDMAFWFSLLAFGYHLNFFETLFLFLFANSVGSAVPTPGGLGAVETVMSTTFIGAGVPDAIAVSATLLFRLATYWLRMALGGLYMKYMEKRNLL